MSTQTQYCVGIDLGTTHSVVAYKEFVQSQIKLFSIPQLTAPGQVENKLQLDSFVYQPHPHELGEGSRVLPWTSSPSALVGAIARNMGSKSPTRLVASAKSWLCHGGVNRRAEILPAGSPEDIAKISPIHATQLYLEHIKNAWDHAFPDSPLAKQDVTITLPASFDPAAREFTAEAAKLAGFEHLTLLEEPQAALYSWIEKAEENWRSQLNVNDVILVVDIGGGTTDLSLVSVKEEAGNLALERIAVGEHILLGGDNMDLALAYQVKNKLLAEGKELQPWQIQAITQACRDAKEILLSRDDVTSVPIVIPSRSSKLLGSTLKCELTKQEVSQFLVDGFFPTTNINEHPVQNRRAALTQMGLPYAQDPAITKHIAAFLCQHAEQTNHAEPFNPFASNTERNFIKPNAILFNGGVLKSEVLKQRLFNTINQWLIDADHSPAQSLQGTDFDLAVAHGAAYYSQVRHGKGVRIRGGIAASYYIGVESALPAIPGMPTPVEAFCIAPFGMEEGTSHRLEHKEFGLVIGQPVHFQFFSSTVRQHDQVGVCLDSWQEHELIERPEIHLTLEASQGRQTGEVVPVKLKTTVNELGTLNLMAVASDNGQQWSVEFDLRTE